MTSCCHGGSFVGTCRFLEAISLGLLYGLLSPSLGVIGMKCCFGFASYSSTPFGGLL